MVKMTGKLWDDTSKGKRSLEECIRAAQDSHRRGMGCDATVCYINPNAHPDAPVVVEGVQIRRGRHVSPNYYWIGCNGVEDEPVEEPEAEPEPQQVINPEDPSYECQKCGKVWYIPAAWCAKCGWDGKEFVYGR